MEVAPRSLRIPHSWVKLPLEPHVRHAGKVTCNLAPERAETPPALGRLLRVNIPNMIAL